MISPSRHHLESLLRGEAPAPHHLHPDLLHHFTKHFHSWTKCPNRRAQINMTRNTISREMSKLTSEWLNGELLLYPPKTGLPPFPRLLLLCFYTEIITFVFSFSCKYRRRRRYTMCMVMIFVHVIYRCYDIISFSTIDIHVVVY